jgi:hypothetical protein
MEIHAAQCLLDRDLPLARRAKMQLDIYDLSAQAVDPASTA